MFVPQIAGVADLEGLVLVDAHVAVRQPKRVFARAFDLGVVRALALVAPAQGGARDDHAPAFVEEVLRQFRADRVVCAEHGAHLPAVGPAERVFVPAEIGIFVFFVC